MPHYEKSICPHCYGIDTRRYPKRGYCLCFTCDKTFTESDNLAKIVRAIRRAERRERW